MIAPPVLTGRVAWLAPSREGAGVDEEPPDWSAFDLLPDAVMVWDGTLRCRYANPPALHHLGVTRPDEILGRSMEGLQTAEEYLPQAQAALAGRPRQIEHTVAGDAGRSRHLRAAYTPWRSAGRVVGLVLTLTDVTAAIEQQAQRNLDDAVAELAAATVGDVVTVADAQGRYEWASPSSLLVTGWAPQELVGRSLFDLVHPLDEPLVRARWAEQVAGAPMVGVEYRRRRPDGSYQWVESRIRPVETPDGRVTGSVASIRDVDDRHRLREELTDALETLELSFAAAPIGKALVGADGRWLRVNPALSAITGRTQAELLAGSFQDITHPDDLDADLQMVGEVLRGERAGYEMEKRYVRPDGREVWVLLDVAAARRRDGSFRFFVVQVQDISRRKADAQALQHRADHDPLTGLWNRRRFTDALAACYRGSRRSTDRPVLLMLDLDGFKAINDRQGHAAGDAHLRDVAAVLRDSVRDADGCARLGGDEFAVLLADADPGTTADVARRVADRVTAFGRGSVSIGAAAWRADRDVDRWLQAADRAMYQAKAGHPSAAGDPPRRAPHRAGTVRAARRPTQNRAANRT